MSRLRFGPRWVFPISTVAVTALLSFALVGPADAAVGDTSLSVTKTMSSQLVRTFGWTLSKSAAPSTLTLDAGESATVEYTVGAARSTAVMSATFTGEICVTNTGAAATQGLQIIDTLSKPPKKAVIASTVVDVSGHPVLAPAERHCYPYLIDLATGVVPGTTYKDTAKVTITNKAGRASGASPSATAVLPASASVVNNAAITVADTNGSTFTFSASGSQTYTQTFECGADAGTHTNTVSAEGFVSTATVDTPAPVSATVTVVCRSSDVGVVKTADAATVDAGGAVGFTVVASNEGTATASGVSLSDPLPAGVVWAIDSQSGDGCAITGAASAQVLTCDFGSLAMAATASVHVVGVTGPEDCGMLSNTATVFASNEPASAVANNSSTAMVTVQC